MTFPALNEVKRAAEESGLTPALACRNLTVTYGPVVALDDVTLDFSAGKIHAVVGQNGAGKTTFGRVCAGLVHPDKGRLLIGGNDVQTGDVGRARALGVELVHQNFALPPSFTVAEVMEFGAQRPALSFYSSRQLRDRWTDHLRSLGIDIEPSAKVGSLPVELRQGIEIAKALVNDATILILDEPTAVLTPASIDRLFERVGMLKAHGVTVLLILHKLREVLRIADTVSVLRGGRLVEGPISTASTNADTLARSIVGTSVDTQSVGASDRSALVGLGASTPPTAAVSTAINASPTAVNIAALETRADSSGPALNSISLAIAPGEIVGVAGVEGNGQRQLVEALAAIAPVVGGTIFVGGKDITSQSLQQRRNEGLRIIPFERNVEGLSLSSALWENWSIRTLLSDRSWKLINPSELQAACRRSLDDWNVRFEETDQPASALSGGNAQKVILAREIDDRAQFIVAAQPTRGLDIAATSFVWNALRQARDNGCSILLISSDLDELFDVCDRIAVMFSGAIVAEFAPPYDLRSIGSAMMGATR